jgi:small-conductance mechanosensitive channel
MIFLQSTPSGAVEKFLVGLGVPYADAIGSAITFVVVFAVLAIVGRVFVLPLVSRLLDARGLDRHAKIPLRKLTMGLVVFVATAVAFGLAGYGSFLTSLATIAAAGTLAVGFAMQDVIKNFVAGIFIFTDKPFRIGDWVEWDGYTGIVEDISLRVTRVRTFDNELLTVPNSQLTDRVIKNPVAKGKLRVKFLFGIDYGDDIEAATDIILAEAAAHPDILDEPEPTVRLTELGDSSVGLQARIWIADPDRADYLQIRGEFVTDVKEAFDEADISIPFPQRTLHGEVAVSESRG